jgi:hypothetical protein
MRLLLMATLVLAGCASGPSLSQAIAVHNTAKHVVEAADAAVTPVYRAAAEAADVKFPDDEVAYSVAMADFNALAEALTTAKKVEQGLNLAIDQWQAGADDGHMTKEVAACGGEAMRMLGQHAATLGSQVGNWIYAAVTTLSFQLTQLADGKACSVK